MIATLLAATVVTAPPPNVRPTPIGVGSRYHLRAAPARVLRGEPVAGRRCERGGARFGVHVELFANRRALLVPSGIGVAAPFARRGADVVPRGCTYATRTRTPTGVVEVRAGRSSTLRDLFAIWGQPLGARRLAGFRGAVHAFVGGLPWRGAVAAIPLRRHAQIVLEVGGFVPPHPSYVFPGGL